MLRKNTNLFGLFVDLDPERKQQSVNIIKDFAKDNQVIFTTCDPQTAELLGGNIIRI